MKKLQTNQVNHKKQKGSVAVEYMILTVFIGLTIAAGATFLGQALNRQYFHTGKMVYSMDSRGGEATVIARAAQ